MHISLIIRDLLPGAEFRLNGENYSDIVWTDARTKPTLAAINAHKATAQANSDAATKKRTRLKAYSSISDPLWIDYIIEKELGNLTTTTLDAMKAAAETARDTVKTDNPL